MEENQQEPERKDAMVFPGTIQASAQTPIPGSSEPSVLACPICGDGCTSIVTAEVTDYVVTQYKPCGHVAKAGK